MMTDQPTNAASDSARLEAELEDAEQMHANLSRAMRMQFASAWQNDPEVANQPVEVFLSGEPGIVEIEPDEDNGAASGSVHLDVDLQVNDPRDMVVRTPEGEQISHAEAASRLGLDTDVATTVISKAGNLVRDDAAQHRTLDELQGNAEQALNALEADGRVTTYDELLDPEYLAGEPEYLLRGDAWVEEQLAERERTQEPQEGRVPSIEEALDRAADLYDYEADGGSDDQTLDVANGVHSTLLRQFEGVATESQIDAAVDRYIEGPSRAKTSGLVDSLADARRTMSNASRYAHDEPARARRILREGLQEASTAIDAVVQSVGFAAASEDLEAEPEWASDPVDRAYTPERVSADWIQATATVSAYLASDREDLARNLIDEIDTNLRDFASGGYPPGSDELAGIYTDAIYRAAIPYGPSPISAEEVARQLNSIGLTVPTIDLDTIASRTGVTPLSPQHTVNRVDGDFAAAWDEGVGSSYSQPVSHGPVVDYGFGTPSVTVSIGDARDWDSTFRLSLERDGSAALTVSGDDPVDIATIAETTGLPEQEIQAITTGATTALRSTLPTPEVEPEPALDPALVDVAAARMNVRRAIASISENSEAAQDYLMTANKRLNVVVELLRPDQAREDVLAVQESVQQASEKVAAVAETATKVDTEVTLYTTPECVGCAATKRTLDKAGVEYEEVPLQEHPDLVQQFKRQGLAQAPIVETKDGERWSGFNPKKLREHGLDHRSRQQRQGGAGTDQGYER
ncbi:glutaredoxin domain-containing protein [Brachybacterium tyrofermentans]|uniref:glutaredoxin domain-containing protein n=1 Tax=Brachybacterium tyrofermentans TaxID=47848 RepID=UPI003FCF6AD5